jgi:hypothetical protein
MSPHNGEVIHQQLTGKQSPKCVSHFEILHNASSDQASRQGFQGEIPADMNTLPFEVLFNS